MGHHCLCAPCRPLWGWHLPGAEEPPQGCRKPSTQEITSRRGCAGAGCCQIPLHQRSGRHSGCRRSGRLQHSINGTWPSAAALAVGDSCSEGTKTQLSSSRGCAHLAPSPSHYFLPLSTLKKPSRGTPTSPSITPGLAMWTCPHHLPSSRLLPAVPWQRATPRVGLCNAPVLPLLHMGELAAS